jgi:hypothetical protein
MDVSLGEYDIDSDEVTKATNCVASHRRVQSQRRLVLDEGRPVGAAARDLDLPETALHE